MRLKKIAKNVILKGGVIFDPIARTKNQGDVWLKNGYIKMIGEISDPPSDIEIVDCENKIITHGFCDIHSHFREPGQEDKETLYTGSIAAMAGGFTRVCIMPNTDPPIDTPESIRFILDKSKTCPIHIHPIGAVTKNQDGEDLTEMSLMLSEGAIAFSDDGIPIHNSRVMRTALEYSSMLNVPIINHAEDPNLCSDGLIHESFMSNQLGLSGNPDSAEAIMVFRDLELSLITGSKLHVPHVTTEKSVNLIREMKIKNKSVTAEVTPHHLYFNVDNLKSYDTNLKVAPPIRSENDRMSLISALVDGTIDCIATDHAPHNMHDKETTFDLASCGMIGLESCFGAVNKIFMDNQRVELMDLIALLTFKPRKIMGFEYDLFQEGTEAEITVFDPQKEWTFSQDNIKSKSKNSAFLGQRLKGFITLTISRGFIGKN
mgnify:CR=1 FL=1